MSTRWEELLQTSYDALPEEQLCPVGTWRLRGRNISFQKPKEEGKNPAFVLTFSPQEAMSDVSDEEMANAGDYDFSANDIFHRVWIEKPKDLRNMVHLLEACGIVVDKSLPLMQAITEAGKNFKGAEVLAYLKVRTFETKDGQTDSENTASNFTRIE